MCWDLHSHYYSHRKPGLPHSNNNDLLSLGMLNVLGLVGHWDRFSYIPKDYSTLLFEHRIIGVRDKACSLHSGLLNAISIDFAQLCITLSSLDNQRS